MVWGFTQRAKHVGLERKLSLPEPIRADNPKLELTYPTGQAIRRC